VSKADSHRARRKSSIERASRSSEDESRSAREASKSSRDSNDESSHRDSSVSSFTSESEWEADADRNGRIYDRAAEVRSARVFFD